MVLEKILESPLYNKEIKPLNLKGNQPVTPADSAEASTEGLQVERTDASTAKSLTMAGPSKQFVAPPMEKLRKAEGSVFPGSPDTCVAFSPAAWEAKEGSFWSLEEGDGSRIYWGHHLPSRTGKDRADISGRDLVTGVWDKGNQLSMKYLTQTPLEVKPSDKFI